VKRVKLKKILQIICALLIIFVLTGCQKQNDNELLKQKVDEEIQYLDTSLVSLLNRLNNISFENYYVTTEKVKLNSASQNSPGSNKQSEENSSSEQSVEGNKEGSRKCR